MKIFPLNNINIINFVLNNFQQLNGFLVGGCVRDWYLNKKCNDIDFTFKEYPKEVATYLIKKYKFKANEFPQFLTIRLLSKKNRIDLSSFRKEKYPKPASLPIVEKASSIEEDLYRRDFTSNAIAISLNKNKIFDIIDPYQGIKDIKNKIIRVIHEKSFIDDPTRIFRAIRFSERFGWEIERKTKDLIIESKRYIKLLSPARIRNEIIKILSEKKCYSMLKKIIDMGILTIDELFYFDEKIDNVKNFKERCIYIAIKNKSINFFEKYQFERKLKNFLKEKLKSI